MRRFLLGTARLEIGKDHLLHHLAYDAVGEDHGRVAVLERQFEGEVHEVRHLLHRRGCEGDEAVVAVAAALDGLEIIRLAGLDGSESRAAAHAVEHNAREFGSGDVGHAFLHEGDTRAGRRRHDALAGACAAVDHVDGSQLALCLKHHHAGGLPGLLGGKGFEDFALRGDRVSEISVAAAADGSEGDGLVAFDKTYFFLCHDFTPPFCDKR